MKNRKLRKFLMLVSSALLLVCVTVGATVAYLTAESKQVVNTFTVGNVSFDGGLTGGLDEAKVNVNGQPVDANGTTVYTHEERAKAPRVTANIYKLIPGKFYTKDPTVHIGDNSEDAWLFVKITNEIADIEDTNDTIVNQMTSTWENDAGETEGPAWTAIDADKGIYAYYMPVEAGDDILVFDHFQLAGDANVAAYEGKTIKIEAYIVQKEGFDTAENAWAGAPLTKWTTPEPDAGE